MANRRFSGKPDNNAMKIMFELLLVLAPVFFLAVMLWACLFMAGMADRDEALRLADGENWHSDADEDFEPSHQKP